MPLEVSIPIGRPRNIDTEVENQKLVDIKTKSHRSEDQKSEGQKKKGEIKS